MMMERCENTIDMFGDLQYLSIDDAARRLADRVAAMGLDESIEALNCIRSALPEVSRDHYVERFKAHIKGWRKRGYSGDIPDSAPRELETKHWVPSWRRLCKVLLRNDWWCKGLGMTQPKSEAYAKYLKIKKEQKVA